MFQKDKLSYLLDAPIAKPDPLSLPALIAWLETNRGSEPYCYADTGHCLAAQYCASVGMDYRVAPILNLITASLNTVAAAPFVKQLEWIACKGERTFADALSRARAVAAEQVGK